MSASMSASADAGGMPMPAEDPAATAPSTGDNVLVTICRVDDGTFMVYAGDEPDAEAPGDMSEDDTTAMGPAGDAPAPAAPAVDGQPADSVGAALKIAMDIMRSDADSAGAPGDADSQFAAGFGADKNPTPVGSPMAQKY